MINIKFYQICYSDSTYVSFDSKVKIFDQRKNPYYGQREVFHFIDFFNKIIKKNKTHYYSLLSPKFLEKIPENFANIKAIAKSKLKNHDVFLINTDPKMVYFFFNVWYQGDYFHPKLKRIVNKVPTINLDYRNDIFTTYYSNYFVANYKFWNLFINYVKDKIEDIEKYAKNDLSKSVMNHSAPLYTFILERLLSNFIVENKNKFKMSQYKYSKEAILKTTTNFFDRYLIYNYIEVIDKLDLKKSKTVKKIMLLIQKSRINYKNKTFFEKFLFFIKLIFDKDILRLKSF